MELNSDLRYKKRAPGHGSERPPAQPVVLSASTLFRILAEKVRDCYYDGNIITKIYSVEGSGFETRCGEFINYLIIPDALRLGVR
jgi:hypothetical protein